MNCIDLTSKRSKCWVTSQNIQKKAKLQKWSKSNDLHRFDVKTIKMLKYFAKHSKQRKTTKLIKLQWIASIWCQSDQKTQNYKSNQITINLRRFDVKTIKMLRYFAKHSKQRKTIKLIKLHWIASIWRQNNQKCWVTSQNIQNNAKLRKWSNYNELHRLVVKTI